MVSPHSLRRPRVALALYGAGGSCSPSKTGSLPEDVSKFTDLALSRPMLPGYSYRGALSRGVGGSSRRHSFQHRFLLDMGERQVCRVERSFSGLRSFGVCGGSRRVLSPWRMPVHAPIHLSADLSVLVLSTRNDALFGGFHDVGDCHTASLPGDRVDGHSPRGCCPCSDHAGGGEKYSAGPYGLPGCGADRLVSRLCRAPAMAIGSFPRSVDVQAPIRGSFSLGASGVAQLARSRQRNRDGRHARLSGSFCLRFP